MPLGNGALALGLVCAFLALAFYFLSSPDKSGFFRLAHWFYRGIFIFSSIASVYLLILLLSHNFEVAYVVDYSSSDLPAFYLISAFWAGQEGSFLLWLWLSAILGLFIIKSRGELEKYTMIFYISILIFLLVILLKKSPFERSLEFAPEGKGLNPLLQDPWMVIHPPLIFLGYAALAVPFCYALAGLVKNAFTSWSKSAFKWTVFGSLSLGAGIFVGGFWAYKVLGWGGYWGWDPVENASLIPWLTTLALLHGIILERKQKILYKTNLILALLSFLLVIYGTFLTRSGVLADFSVHSFTDLGINNILILFMFSFLVFSAVLFLSKLRLIPDTRISRQFSQAWIVVIGIIVLCVMAALVGLGTSAPLITKLFGKPSNVSMAYYLRTTLPLAVFLALSLALSPTLKTENLNFKSWLKQSSMWIVIAAIISGSILFFFADGESASGGNLRSPVLVIAVFLSFLLFLTNLSVFIKLFPGDLAKSGAFVSHMGMGLLLAGIIFSSSAGQSRKINLPKEKTQQALGFQVSYLGSETEKNKSLLKIELQQEKNKISGQMELTYSPYTQNYVHKPYIKRGLLEDFYLSPLELKTEQPNPGEEILMKKGQSLNIGPYSLEFKEFQMGSHQEQEAVSVGAVIEVKYGNQKETLIPEIIYRDGEPESQTVELPGNEDKLILKQVLADSKEIILAYQSGSDVSSSEILILDFSKKPLISLVWAGSFLILAGFIISAIRK